MIFASGLSFDPSVSFGTILQAGAYLFLGILVWRDLHWRTSNLETWRKEHMIDSDARDVLIRNSEAMLAQLKFLVEQLKFLVEEERKRSKEER
jgi:hypothetical protein